MASPYRRVYPQDGYLLFDGGLNSKYEKAIIEDNESPDCLNVVFENGSVGTRGGATKLNTTAIGTFVGDGLYVRRDDDGAETMIAFAGGTAWQLGTTTFTTISSAQSVFTSGVRVCSAEYEEHRFFGNGYVIPYNYNGTDWTRHGVYPPTTTSTVATAPTGVGLTGVYSYKVTYVNTQSVESDVGPVSNTMTAANENIRITSIPVAPQSFGIAARRLYRTESGGSTYKRVITISDNTTTTYDDAVADGSLGATAPTDKGVPPLYAAIVYHANRLFMVDFTNPNYLYYTDLAEPYTVAATNFIKIGDGTSDIIKGLGVYDNSVVCFCEKSIYMVYMPSTTASEWQVVKSKSAYGSKSPYCLLEYNNKLLFLAVQNDKIAGFAALSGDTVDPSATLLTVSSAGSDLKSDRIETDVFDFVSTYVRNVSGLVFKNKAYISVTKASGNTTNNRVYVMDFSISRLNKNQKEAWVPFTGWNAAQFCVYGGNLYYISSTATGFVYKYDTSVYSDDGSAINSYFWTKEFSGFKQDINSHKDFRFGNFLVDKAGAYYMGISYRVDSDQGQGNETIVDLDPGSTIWGSFLWGGALWGSGSGQEQFMVDLGTAAGKRIQFKFSNRNTAGQRFKVHRGSLSYNVRGSR